MANHDDDLIRNTINVIYYFGLMIPPTCLIDILRKMTFILEKIDLAPNTPVYSITDDSGIGLNLLLLLVSGFVYLILCIMKDLNVFGKLRNKMIVKYEKFPTSSNVDSDVEEEIDKVTSMTESEITESVLVLKKLSKFYGNCLAVNQLCLSVDPGECFG